MLSALQSALSAVQTGRNQSANTTSDRARKQDNRQQFTGSYAGYRNGSHYARLPNGGQVPIQPKTNGAIARGQVLAAQNGGASKLFGIWNPR